MRTFLVIAWAAAAGINTGVAIRFWPGTVPSLNAFAAVVSAFMCLREIRREAKP